MDGLNPRQHSLVAWFSRVLGVLLFVGGTVGAQTGAPVAPPPAPPVLTSGALSNGSPAAPSAPAGGLYSIGNPTNEEQYYLELINRARANPPAEGIRLAFTTDQNVLSAYGSFGVNLVL